MKNKILFTCLLISITLVAHGQRKDSLYKKRFNIHDLNKKNEDANRSIMQGNKFPKKNCFSHNTKTKYENNIKQRLDSIIHQIKNPNINQWIDDEKEIYIYNNHIINRRLNHKWRQSTNEWIPQWKTQYSYGASGNFTQELFYTWDTITNLWSANSK